MWHQTLESKPLPFEALRDQLLRLVSFDLKEATSSAAQYLGLLSSATRAGTWYGNPDYSAPPGVAGYERTLFDLFLDFEPVLNHAEAEIRDAQSTDDLQATHALVESAQEQMVASVRDAATRLSPEARAALRSVDDCAYLLGPTTRLSRSGPPGLSRASSPWPLSLRREGRLQAHEQAFAQACRFCYRETLPCTLG